MKKIYLLLYLGLYLNSIKAQTSISVGSTVTESFNIGTSATASLPSNWRIDNLSVGSVRTVGTYASAPSTTTQRGGNNMSISASNGRYNFGAGAADLATDRAVGGLSSSGGSGSVNVYTFLQNTGSSNIDSLIISYDVEKYRQGSNAAGFRIQLYYSTDGVSWTNAGTGFFTSFSSDANNNGYASAPGVTTAVASTLAVTIPVSGSFYLAWNYSVTSGSTTTNAQALGIDNVSITGKEACVSPSLSSIITDVNCNGFLTGSIDLTATGGTLPIVSYAWTGPGGFTASTEDIGGLAAGTYDVVVTATGGCTATASYNVAEPSALSASAVLDAAIECPGGLTSITVTAYGGTSPYDGVGSFSVSAGSYFYTITDANGCNATTNTIVVADGTGTAPGQPLSPTFAPSQKNLCNEASFTLSVPNDPSANFYTWTVPLGFTGSSSTNTIVITPSGGTFAKVTFPVTATNACGTSPVRNVNIYGQPSAPSISGITCITGPTTGLVYTVSNAEAGVTYNWSVPNNVVIQSGQGTSSITVDWNRNNGGRIKVNGSNACGVSVTGRIDLDFCEFSPVTATLDNGGKSFIYPNPSNSNTNLVLTTTSETKITILITDMSGRNLLRKDVVALVGQNRISLNTANLAKGIYFISVSGGKSVQQLKFVKE